MKVEQKIIGIPFNNKGLIELIVSDIKKDDSPYWLTEKICSELNTVDDCNDYKCIHKDKNDRHLAILSSPVKDTLDWKTRQEYTFKLLTIATELTKIKQKNNSHMLVN